MANQVEQTYQLSILVELENEADSLKDLQDLVNEVLVEDANLAAWVVRPFFDQVDPARGHEGLYEVEGFIPVSPSYSVRDLGFDLAATLSERLTGSLAGVAMPDFPSDTFGHELIENLDATDATEAAEAPEESGAAPLAPQSGRAASLGWPLLTMRCNEAWALDPPRADGRQRGEGIRIGHPDTGYTFHQEIVGSMDLAKDFDVIDSDLNAEDPMKKRWWWPLDNPGHGTSTGSVIVSTETDIVTGAAPAATLVPFRAIKSVAQVSDGDVARAIDRAVAAGAHVISMSLGGIGFYGGIRAALRRARSAGVIVMAAAGNHVKVVVAPARFSECIAVAATDRNDKPWSGSSRGDAVLIAAPGHRVPVAKAEKGATENAPSKTTGVSSGTSYAVAHLAGVAALWLAHHGRDFLIVRYGENGLQSAFEQILTSDGSHQPANWDLAYGEGIVDAVGVLQADLPEPQLHAEAAAVSSDSQVERLAELMSQPVPDVRAELCDVLQCNDDDLDELASVHGAELAFIYAEGRLDKDRDAFGPESAMSAEAMNAEADVRGGDLQRRLRSAPSMSRRLRNRVVQ